VELLYAGAIGDRTFEQEPLTALDTGREYAEAHLFIDSLSLSECAAMCLAAGIPCSQVELERCASR
jgi:hypothetical protein